MCSASFTRPARRASFAIVANIIRAGANFATNALIARALDPVRYGEYAYMFALFASLRVLIDSGPNSAFYTLISQGGGPGRYIRIYFPWMALQVCLISILVWLPYPSHWFHAVWQSETRITIFLVFLASFFQFQLWAAVVQIGESMRRTVSVQSFVCVIAVLHLCFTFILAEKQMIGIGAICVLIISEFGAASILVWLMLRGKAIDTGVANLSQTGSPLTELIRYSGPLILASAVSASCDIFDRWMLQHFGSSVEQAYLQVGLQIASSTLIVTTAILQILWKEVAEATSRKDYARVWDMYIRCARATFLFSSLVSSFCVCWSSEIIMVVYGKAFIGAASVMAIVLYYPVYQSLGQITGTVVLGFGKPRLAATSSVAFTIVGAGVSYLLLSPISGEGLGAVGIAIKMLGLSIISVNVLSYLLSRSIGRQFVWKYQIASVVFAFVIALVARRFALAIATNASVGTGPVQQVYTLGIGVCINVALSFVAVWRFPGLAGFTTSDFARWSRFRRA